MIDHLSKNEARDEPSPYGEECYVMGFSPPSMPFTVSPPVQNKAAKKCSTHESLSRSFIFKQISPEVLTPLLAVCSD